MNNFSGKIVPQAPDGLRDTITASVLDRIERHPDKPCLIFFQDGLTVTFAELWRIGLRQAGLMRAAGVGRGDVVMLFLPTGPEAYGAFLGAMLLGAAPSLMPGPSPKQEPGQYWRDHATLLARTEPRLLVADEATARAIADSGLLDETALPLARADDAAEPLPPDSIVMPRAGDVAFLQHSSGTTGLKKGVMLGHGAVIAQIRACAWALRAGDADTVATWLPIYHDMGLISSTLMPLVLGQTTVVLDPFAWAARPVSLLEAMARHRATLTWMPNFGFEHLVRTTSEPDAGLDLSHVRAFINCSEPCRPATVRRFVAHFAAQGVRPAQVHASYGMAETVFAVSQTVPEEAPRTLVVAADALRAEGRARPPGPGEAELELLSNGPVIPGLNVRILRPDGMAAADREVGEVTVWGDCLFDGYFRLPDQTAAKLIDGRYHTRDMGFLADGEIYILGRTDDMIIVHGRNYYAGEVEAAVNLVPGVKPGRAVAFGVDNPDVGSHDIVVVAEPHDPSADPRLLSRHIKQSIQRDIGLTLREARIVETGWLAKTTSGKISRERNRARYLEERCARP